jgi:hypothetical protein
MVHYEPGLGAGRAPAARTGTNAPFSPGPINLGTKGDG